MSRVTWQRTPTEQIEVVRQQLQQLIDSLPMGNNRPNNARRAKARTALEVLNELEENLAHIEEHGTLKTFGSGNSPELRDRSIERDFPDFYQKRDFEAAHAEGLHEELSREGCPECDSQPRRR